jgi:hypothetical protein
MDKPRANAPKPSSHPPRRRAHGPDQVKDRRDPHLEAILDEGLEETFPASDPVSVSPRAN